MLLNGWGTCIHISYNDYNCTVVGANRWFALLNSIIRSKYKKEYFHCPRSKRIFSHHNDYRVLKAKISSLTLCNCNEESYHSFRQFNILFLLTSLSVLGMWKGREWKQEERRGEERKFVSQLQYWFVLRREMLVMLMSTSNKWNLC